MRLFSCPHTQEVIEELATSESASVDDAACETVASFSSPHIQDNHIKEPTTADLASAIVVGSAPKPVPFSLRSHTQKNHIRESQAMVPINRASRCVRIRSPSHSQNIQNLSALKVVEVFKPHLNYLPLMEASLEGAVRVETSMIRGQVTPKTLSLGMPRLHEEKKESDEDSKKYRIEGAVANPSPKLIGDDTPVSKKLAATSTRPAVQAPDCGVKCSCVYRD